MFGYRHGVLVGAVDLVGDGDPLTKQTVDLTGLGAIKYFFILPADASGLL